MEIEITGADIGAIYRALRREARMYTPGSFERKQVDSTLKKFEGLNLLNNHTLLTNTLPFPS